MNRKLFSAAGYCLGAIAAICALALLAGCVNCYTRCPGTDVRIEAVYQPSRTAVECSVICAFPQMMSDCPSDDGFKSYNVLTVPLGFLILGDALCESVLDTMFLPADYFISKSRKED